MRREIYADRAGDATRRRSSQRVATALSLNGITRSAKIWTKLRLPPAIRTASPERAGNRGFDGQAAVGLDADPTGLVETRQDIGQDLGGVFRMGVADGQDYAIGSGFSDCRQGSSLSAVSSAAITAQDAVHAAGADRSQRGQGLCERDRVLGRVESDLKILTF